jgi:hypothetical protein
MHLWGIKLLTGEALAAADFNSDNSVYSIDLEYYSIYTSTDGSNFTQLHDNSDNTTYGFNVDYLGGANTRYVQVKINKSVKVSGSNTRGS